MIEEWKDVEGFPGYEVSNTGYVRSNRKNYPPVSSKILKPKYTFNFYGTRNRAEVNIVDQNGKRKNKSIARLVATAFLPNPEGLPQVHHKDHNIDNNCVENLYWSKGGNK